MKALRRWPVVLAVALLVVLTGLALAGALGGWGLPGLLDEPLELDRPAPASPAQQSP